MPRYTVTPPISVKRGAPVIFGSLAGESSSAMLIGRLNEAGPLHTVEANAGEETVVAIFGKRGSGKSFTLGVIAEGLCPKNPNSDIGRWATRKGALLFDTLNVFWSTENPLVTAEDADRFPAETSRLSSWGIRPSPLNVKIWVPIGFRNPHTPDHYQDFAIPTNELTSEDVADLFDLDPQRDLIGQLLVEARDKTAERLTEFNFDDMRETLETDQEIQEFYADSTVRATRQRLRSISQIPLFNAPSGIPLSELLVAGQLSILELGDVPNSLRTVVASVLLRRIHRERARASDAEKQLLLNTRLTQPERDRLEDYLRTGIPPAWVLIDEAQNILPSARDVKSSDAVVRFVREGRNFGLSFAFTSQQPSAVDQRILSQADTVICHKLTVAGDISRVRDNLKCAEPKEVKLAGETLDLAGWLRSLDQGQAIVTNTDFERVFAIEIRPRVSPHGGVGFVALPG